ncbi:MAG: AI-2E family transporter [Elusimicrobiota bacterium]
MAENRRDAALLTALLILAAVLYAFYRVHEALTPFVLAAAFAYVVNPLVSYFEAKGLRRLHLICAGYFIAGLLTALVYVGVKSFIVNETIQLGANGPLYLKKIQLLSAVVESKLAHKLPLPPAVSAKALDSVVNSGLERLQSLPSVALDLIPFLLHGLLVPFIGFFLLMDASDGLEGIIQATPSRYVEQEIHLIGEIDASLGGYLRGILITALVIGSVSFIGLVILGVDNALEISLLSGACSVIPYMGAAIGIVVGGAMAWYQFGTIWAAAKVALFFIGIRVADEIVLQPVISRQSVHLHPMVNLLVLVLGAETFGFMGLVFAVPAACIMKALIKVGWSWYASESGFELPPSASCEAVPYT